MTKTLAVAPADLLLDEENPRISEPDKGQNEAIRALIVGEGEGDQFKFLNLATDIVENGLDESNLPIIMKADAFAGRFIVLEGNRRVSALKVLENPDILDGAVSSPVMGKLRKLSAKYQLEPIRAVNCLVAETRETARHWIEIRHNGQDEGRGIVPWGSQERARFGLRSDLALQILDALVSEKLLTAAERRKVKLTNLQRVVANREVREKLGVDLSDGKLIFTGDKQRSLRALARVADDIGSGRVKVKDIYNTEKIVQYAAGLPADLVQTPLQADVGPRGTKSRRPTGATKKAAAKRAKRAKRDRDYLIPKDCALAVSGDRLVDIEEELRKLSLTKFPNAVSVLMRVFVELTVDDYLRRHKLPVKGGKETLARKLGAVCDDLVEKKKLTREEAKPVRRAAARDSFLAPSVDLMHGYVHNAHIFPIGGDLRSSWDSLQRFLTVCWE